ncbi:MAG: MFS transporter [Caldilinea sp.]|nr:MFS transporter [Caldilineaceae bacterium]MCB9122624.1 MFS transporter [Caldilineaceae bacterium]MCO5213957.1 MFS transporter [Caldilinea sp.]
MTSQTIDTPAADLPVAATQTERFQTGQVATIAGGHFMHDTFGAFLAPLLPLIQDNLGTNYMLTGGLTIFTQLPSLLNPFLGYAADRMSVRYFVILAPGFTATLMTLIGFAPNYMALAMLLLAGGVSIAAFHAPAPAMTARVSGNRVGTGMSIFMATGELGRTVGPIVAVAAVSWWGLDGIWRLAALGWLTSAVLYWRLHTVPARPRAPGQDSLSAMWPQVKRVFPVITWVIFPKVFLAVTITTYLAIFMRDQLQTSLWLAAASLTILEGAGVVGALLTGTLSDRYGRRQVLFVLLAAAPLILALFLFGPSWIIVPALIGLGLTAISTTPVVLAIVQDQFPDNRATANGIFMFLNFLARTIGVVVVGLLADRFGLTVAFTISGLLALFSVPAIFWLPQKQASV